MNWHKRGDVLEAHCRNWIQETWAGSRIIETKIDSVHGIDFAAEDARGDVRIVEVKSGSGSLSDGQFTIEWIRQRIGSDLYSAICRCVARRRYLIRVLVRVQERADGSIRFSTGTPTGQLTWEQLFPGRQPPSLGIDGASATSDGHTIRVRHRMSGFGIEQIHLYDLPARELSLGLRQVILEQGTFPFIVPHAHTVVEGGTTTYRRGLDEWDAYFSQSDAVYEGPAVKGRCGSCGIEYFHFENEEFCADCFEWRRDNAQSQKRDIIRQAETLAESSDWKVAGEQMKGLMERWKASGSAGREKEEELWSRFQGAQQHFHDRRKRHFDERDRQREANRVAKQHLVDDARRLATSEDWRAAAESHRALMAQWKATGPAGRDHDDALWQAFQSARQTFFDRQKAHFDEQGRQREVNRRVKQQLVEDAKRLAYSEDWKDAADKQRALMAQWKATGPAGRDHDDALWQAFQSARQTFFDRQKAHFDRQERQREDNRQAKQRLVNEARGLTHSSDWKGTAERQRDLMVQWKAIGTAGRDHDDELWQAFQSARQTFFDRQKDHFESMARERERNAAQKRNLVSIASDLSYSSDWKATSDRMRELMARWKEIGPAGREVDDALWADFNRARQRFFERQTEYFEERNRLRGQRR
ncbi:MAG: DUF349 domain-containing protein [Actinomycetota bacterium]